MYIKVIAITGAKKEKFIEQSTDHFEISVKEKAERNLANNKIIELLSQKFKVGKGKVRIINGHRHPHKLILIDK
ncbi:MAG: DUF167 domain-containing protein [Candidatus Pacebacteria bacterium]|nr:DUF167 domain-containing protein [Candidatus Paceibacterota bacterium]MBP9839742.1 DUF167 domain-containing protein [Candidatus Paceibacterota bacterium]MDQ5922469.1 uncharacterized protein [Patescibacteria group bacterium]